MNVKNNFTIDAYEFICGLLECIDLIIIELSDICPSNYEENFKVSKENFNRVKHQIDNFLKKWENNITDDKDICHSLDLLKERYTFYYNRLNASSPSLASRDSMYIMDSINTAKYTFINRLKRLERKL